MRATGGMILAVIPVILALRWSNEIRSKQKLRTAFLEFLSHIRFQIENFLRDQEDIFSRFHNPLLKRSAFFEALMTALSENACGAFGKAWKACGKEFGYDTASMEVLDRFAEHFGMLEKGAQLAELNRVTELLEQKEQSGRKECENKIKILRISGITAGLGILILLI